MHAADVAQVLSNHGWAIRKDGRGYRAQCPGHDGSDLNLHVFDGDEAVILKCHSHDCSLEAILAAVGLNTEDLWFEERRRGNGDGRQPSRIYPYRDETGQVLYEVRRAANKEFSMRKPGAERGGIGQTRRVLFGLPELLATRPGDLVAICEGEKCALIASEMGLAATTNPNGEGQWRAEYTAWLAEHLPGRVFLVLPDNDAPGKKHAVHVCEQLQAAGLEVYLADLGELPPKGDLEQWRERGGTAAALRAMAAPRQPSPPRLWARLLSFSELLKQPAPAWMVEDFAFDMTMLELFGPPNEGKTFIAVDLCRAICRGETWCGRSTDRPGPILYVNADGGPGFADRARAWTLINGGHDSAHEMWTLPEPINLYRPEAIEELAALIAYLPETPVALIIDTYSRCIPGVNENQQEFASLVVHNLTHLMREFRLSPWLLHHTDKSGHHDRGSSVILGACDTQIRCSLDRATNVVTLKCEKQRDQAAFQPLSFDLGRVPGTNEVWVTWRPDGAAPAADRSEAAYATILAALEAEPGLTRPQLYLALDLSEATLKRHLQQLLRAGRITEQALERTAGQRGAPAHGLFRADRLALPNSDHSDQGNSDH
jgi:hypothetical protein